MNWLEIQLKKCVNLYKKNQFVFKLIFIVLLSAMLIIYGRETIIRSVPNEDMFLQSSEGKLTDKIKSGDVIEQQFQISQEDFKGVSVFFATYNSVITQGNINVQVLDKDRKVVEETDVAATEIKDNRYLDIYLDLDFEIGDIYILKLEFQNIENQSISCWLSEDNVYDDYAMKINENENTADLVLKEIKDERDVFYNIYIVVMIVMLILAIAVYFMVYKFNIKLSKIYLTVGIALGLIYMMLIPIYVVPDEPVHIFKAYSVSNKMLGIEENGDGTVSMRKSDAENVFRCTGISRKYYNEYFKSIANFFVDNDEIVATGNRPVSAYAYYYFASGLGLTVGRLLHLGNTVTFLLGRLLNLALFVWAVYYAIKKMPFGKMVVFLWALLPMTLQQAASYSYDSPLFSLSVIIIALTLHLAYAEEDKIKKSDWIILFICSMLLLPAKQFALSPICILPVIVLFKRRKENKKYLHYVLGMMGCLALLLLAIKLLPILFQNGQAEQGGNFIDWAGEPGYTLSEFIRNPLKLMYILFHTIYSKGDFYLQSFLGNSLGWFEINIPLFCVLPYFIMMIFAGMRKDDERVFLSKKIKLFLCGIAFLGIGFASAGMLLGWTPSSYLYIEGVQGRYFIPFAILIFVSIRSNNIAVNRNVDKKLAFSGTWLQMMILAFILMRAV